MLVLFSSSPFDVNGICGFIPFVDPDWMRKCCQPPSGQLPHQSIATLQAGLARTTTTTGIRMPDQRNILDSEISKLRFGYGLSNSDHLGQDDLMTALLKQQQGVGLVESEYNFDGHTMDNIPVGRKLLGYSVLSSEVAGNSKNQVTSCNYLVEPEVYDPISCILRKKFCRKQLHDVESSEIKHLKALQLVGGAGALSNSNNTSGDSACNVEGGFYYPL
ncbi:hypothetical protein NE237_013623 [Protea cynaroides]|uniref:Uncharacterized protein n=1 Tax=Protea cynaroides TaxID=273540 RepID=A0A9Q0JZZ5_9MAGN|nr:hypothetical protein NE237_013623 [Protea cynaroides]